MDFILGQNLCHLSQKKPVLCLKRHDPSYEPLSVLLVSTAEQRQDRVRIKCPPTRFIILLWYCIRCKKKRDINCGDSFLRYPFSSNTCFSISQSQRNLRNVTLLPAWGNSLCCTDGDQLCIFHDAQAVSGRKLAVR